MNYSEYIEQCKEQLKAAIRNEDWGTAEVLREIIEESEEV